MRHLALAATLVVGAAIGTASTAAAADPSTDGLVISEYVEGSSFNKAIEIYNGTGASVDLSAFAYRAWHNGNVSIRGTVALSGDLADGEVYVIANPQASAGILAVADQTSGTLDFNGNDVVSIVEGDTIVDSIGQIGNGDSFAPNTTLRRVDFTRDTDASDATDLSRFSSFPSDTVDDLGVAPGDTEPPPPPPPSLCDIPADELDLISSVQGVGDDGSMAGVEVTVRGVVTLADSDIDGFFVQEEVSDVDADPATSEGIYVFDLRNPLPLEGQTVTLRDTVGEFRGETSLSFPDIDVCDVDLVTIEPTPLVLPLDDDAREAFEGMVVTNAQDLQVTGLFTAYRFGELGLALDGPLPQPTSVYAPGTPEAAALAAENAAKELFVNDRDEAFGQFNPYPWERFDEDLSAGDTMPAGRLVGALKYSFGDFKVEPLDNEVGSGDRIFFPETDDTFERPAAPALADGNDIATFNVLNYFNTFGLRGADDQEEFDLQTAKIVDAIQRLDASIIGLMEIENDYEDFYDGDPATVPSVVTLVEALNADAGFAKWSYVQPPESVLVAEGLGPDEIANAIIYQSARASTVLPATTFDIDELLVGEDPDKNRWPIAQAFDLDDNRVTVVVNHFKSKGSSCDDIAGPGFALGEDAGSALTGNCDLTRQYAAERLVEWVETKGNPVFANGKVFLMGDFNSYEEEAPIEILVDAGYVDLVQRNGDDAFTFKFSGRFGRLDYVFASSKIARKVTDAEVWQINSPAPVGYIYFNDPIDETAHGSSDHDPVVVALR